MQKEHIVGAISLLAGILAIVFRVRLAIHFVEVQNRVWGFHFGEREVKANIIVLCIAGASAIVIGLLAFFQVIHFKQ